VKHLLPIALSLFAVVNSVCADDSTPILVRPGPVISQPDFKTPLGPEWSIAKGQWNSAEGVLTAVEVPDEHHAAVLHLATGPVDMVVDCEFRFNGGKIFYVGCDGAKHVGRVVITEKSAKVCEDSTEVKGKTPSHTLAEAKLDLKQGDWQRLHVEYTGDKLVARLNGQELRGEDPHLTTAKVRWWFASSGDNVQLRNVRFSEGTALAGQP
jgi:hypothetical protein